MKQQISPQLSYEREQEFIDLLEEHRDYIIGCAVNLFGNRDRQIDNMNYEDLVQETQIKAFKYFDSFQSGTNFKAWIRTIMYNLFINCTRRGKLRRTVSVSEFDDQADKDIVDISAPYQPEQVCKEFSGQISEILGVLPEGFAELLILVDVKNYDYKSAAAELGIPLGTVMSRLSRARGYFAEAAERIWRESTGIEPNRQFLDD